jgi:hypothetical protein
MDPLLKTKPNNGALPVTLWRNFVKFILRVGFDKKDFLRMFAPPGVQARA